MGGAGGGRAERGREARRAAGGGAYRTTAPYNRAADPDPPPSMADTPARPGLLLVDASVYLHRAHHVHARFTDHHGRPTGALYGAVNTIQKQLRRVRPERVAVVLDAPGKNFRHELYPAYKANRPPMDPELRAQIDPLCRIIAALGLPLLRVPGVEADDVIGTLARQGREAGLAVVILSADKDMAQLVGGGVALADADKEPLDAAGVERKFQVPPERIVDYLTLAGDAADNVPGVPKVGPKTAARWLRRYGSLAGVVEHAAEIAGAVGQQLRDSLGRLPLYAELVTIRCDLELDTPLAALAPGAPDRDALRELYEEYGLRQFWKELNAGAPEEGVATVRDYALVRDEAALADWVARARAAGVFAVDTETTSVDPNRAELVGVSLATAPWRAAYVPFGHTDPQDPPQLPRETALAALGPLLADPELTKLGHHLKYDRAVLARAGVALAGPVHDSMLESYVVNSAPGGAPRHNLDDLARVYLNEETTRYAEVAGSGRKQVSFDAVPLARAAPYAAEDADMTLRLHRRLWPRLQGEPALLRLYRELELPLAAVLGAMERAGVALDVPALAAQTAELDAAQEELRERIFAVCGREFNLNAPRDLQQVLFAERGLEPLRKTPTGAPSTAEDVLEELAKRDELPRMILEHRQRAKLLSTYLRKLPQMLHPDTGRLHTSFHQAGTATGRLSSSDPNLQNIPIRTEQGRRVRRAFVAAPGRALVAADYSQIELRIMAHISGDPALRAAFAAGADVHRATAAEVFGAAPDAVTSAQRRAAKAINFGLMYGMSPFGLAKQLGCARPEAEAYVDAYFARYPKVREYMDRTRAQARERGFVETVWGRRLYLPDIRARDRNRRQYAERTAINAPMQGTAADVIKRAMIDLHAELERDWPDCRLLLQVHDELVLEAPAEQAAAVAAATRARMEAAAELRVPLVVDAGVGPNWEEARG